MAAEQIQPVLVVPYDLNHQGKWLYRDEMLMTAEFQAHDHHWTTPLEDNLAYWEARVAWFVNKYAVSSLARKRGVRDKYWLQYVSALGYVDGLTKLIDFRDNDRVPTLAEYMSQACVGSIYRRNHGLVWCMQSEFRDACLEHMEEVANLRSYLRSL